MIYLDAETTGISITKSRIVQLAIIKGDIEKKVLINPECPIPAETTAIHGITDEMVKDAKTFKQYSKSLLAFIGDEDIAGYNSNSFDIPLLMEEFNRAGLELDMSTRKVHDAYINECIINRRNLETVYKRMTGKTLEDAHDAMADTKATKEILEIQTTNPEYVALLEAEQEDGMNYVDFTRKIYVNEHGEKCWTFGKNIDQPISGDLSYCNWVLKGDFTKQVKDIVRDVING